PPGDLEGRHPIVDDRLNTGRRADAQHNIQPGAMRKVRRFLSHGTASFPRSASATSGGTPPDESREQRDPAATATPYQSPCFRGSYSYRTRWVSSWMRRSRVDVDQCRALYVHPHGRSTDAESRPTARPVAMPIARNARDQRMPTNGGAGMSPIAVTMRRSLN